MASKHVERLLNVAASAWAVCQLVGDVYVALTTPVSVPSPGTMLRISSSFMYMNQAGDDRSIGRRFDRGDTFLLVSTSSDSTFRRRFIIGIDTLTLVMLGPDNTLWKRQVQASMVHTDFEVIKCG